MSNLCQMFYEIFNSTTDPIVYSTSTILAVLAEWYSLGKTRFTECSVIVYIWDEFQEFLTCYYNVQCKFIEFNMLFNKLEKILWCNGHHYKYFASCLLSQIDHFSPLTTLFRVTALYALIQWTVIFPQFGSPLNSNLHAVLFISGNSGSKLINEISYCVIVLATFQEIIFSKLSTKFRGLFLTVKLSRDVHQWCT